ncbi:uncharacterized protein MONOS_10801 [Monocercomonoides exilis]|uniref:uncharacterized protein n=1 Tax=Monocercomonoides exilis TaxID=2049356 RepID=UPI00355AA854|nr:hypothetical protein MONOS_10801 [Monocercomonoides exilis]|eukprot:MONOS_10801.1-p1 / transcript=MONOS_10801.1 / gene=MONOS_10801 / organism=Monocercomonoides_exilis_PA203 / gene_product=unspecified product / transcript_product=unspecified product / location=Mono_scaffold00506:6085-9957(+) / protein_length=994 / sequence_SO=supercontig / SO=protein_coding / is_pseudo=false
MCEKTISHTHEYAEFCIDSEIVSVKNEYTEKLKEICKKFHSRSPKMDDLRTDSKVALELLKKFFGKMETVPSEILNDLLEYGSCIFKIGDDDVIRTYGIVLEMLTNPFSYSKEFRELKEVETEQKADNNKRQTNGKKNIDSEKVAQSDFLTSPLLKQIASKRSLIPAVVERIHTSENDETLSVLSRFLLNVVQMNDSSEAIRLIGQHVLDGLDDILIRCQNADGLSYAIDALCLMDHAVKKHISRTGYNYDDAFDRYGFQGVLMEIIVGNRKRGIVKEVEGKKMTRYNLHNILENAEIEKEEKEDVEDNEEENKETKLKAKKPKKRTKSAERTGNNSKTRIGKAEKKLPAKQESSTKRKRQAKKDEKKKQNELTEANSATASNASSSFNLSETSLTDFVPRNTEIIPISVRLEALLAANELGCPAISEWQVDNMFYVLADSLELDDGEEEEYERIKQKELVATEEDEGKTEEKEDGGLFLKYAKVDFTECDYQNKYQQIRKALIAMIEFLMVSLRHYEKPLPESIVMKASAALIRLIKFPHRAFEHNGWVCISELLKHSGTLCENLIPMLGSELEAELDFIEQEMKDTIEKDAEKREKEYERFFDPKRGCNIPDQLTAILRYTKPRLCDYVSWVEFEHACEKYNELGYFDNFDFTSSISSLSDVNVIQIMFNVEFFIFTPYKFHKSISSQRFHYICSCLAIITLSKPGLADKIVLCSIFPRLMEKIEAPFPLDAPITIADMRSNVLVPQSLESAQINAEFLVVAVLTSVVKELPYVFEIGYVSRMLKWMASKGAMQREMFWIAIKVLREKCTAFSLSSRLNRLEMIGPFNTALAERNAFIEEHADNPWGAPHVPTWDNISQLDDVVCLPPDLSNANSYRCANTMIVPFVSMDEEITEVEKGDDTGTLLLWLLDDAIEESGIRDVVEAAMAHENLQLFWMLPRVAPKLSKNHSNLMYLCYSHSYNDLPKPFAAPSDIIRKGIKIQSQISSIISQ